MKKIIEELEKEQNARLKKAEKILANADRLAKKAFSLRENGAKILQTLEKEGGGKVDKTDPRYTQAVALFRSAKPYDIEVNEKQSQAGQLRRALVLCADCLPPEVLDRGFDLFLIEEEQADHSGDDLTVLSAGTAEVADKWSKEPYGYGVIDALFVGSSQGLLFSRYVGKAGFIFIVNPIETNDWLQDSSVKGKFVQIGDSPLTYQKSGKRLL